MKIRYLLRVSTRFSEFIKSYRNKKERCMSTFASPMSKISNSCGKIFNLLT